MTVEVWMPHRDDRGYFVPAFSRVVEGKLETAMNLNDIGSGMDEKTCAAECLRRNRLAMASAASDVSRLEVELEKAHQRLADIEAAYRLSKIEV